MRNDQCPNCENDISSAVTAAIVSRLQSGDGDSDTLICPNCGTALSLTVNIDTSLLRQSA
jgi:RNA polymerase subunit RPABC4/transcription elongation factor Spt4